MGQVYADVMGFTQLNHFDDEAITTDYTALMRKVVWDGMAGSSCRSTSQPTASEEPDRGVSRLLRRRWRAAHRPRRLTTSSTVRPARAAFTFTTPSTLLRSPAWRLDRTTRSTRTGHARGTGHPRRPGRRGLPAADLHRSLQDRPTVFIEVIERTAPEGSARQLQGVLRGDRARAGRAATSSRPLGVPSQARRGHLNHQYGSSQSGQISGFCNELPYILTDWTTSRTVEILEMRDGGP